MLLDSLFMELFARNESCQCLIIFALAISLPPVRVMQIDHMQYVTLLEQDTELATWN